MRHLSLSWLVFVLVELFAVVSWRLWPSFSSSQLGSTLWGAQLVLLMPGSLVATALTEGPLWNMGLSLRFLSMLDLVLSILINTFLFWLAVRALKTLLPGLRANKSLERTRER